jgi:hypothetical protein
MGVPFCRRDGNRIERTARRASSGPASISTQQNLLPEASTFDAELHGHWSAQRGSSPLVTLFLKT